jgi:hypothetical protein
MPARSVGQTGKKRVAVAKEGFASVWLTSEKFLNGMELLGLIIQGTRTRIRTSP